MGMERDEDGGGWGWRWMGTMARGMGMEGMEGGIMGTGDDDGSGQPIVRS